LGAEIKDGYGFHNDLSCERLNVERSSVNH